MRTLGGVLALTLIIACVQHERPLGPATIQATTDMVYGSDTGAVSFGDIRGIAVDAWGRLYATDGQDATVHVFDSLGQLVRSLGRRGQGPGELDTPQGIAFGPDGNIYLYDAEARRLTVFDTSGAVVTTHPLMISSYGYLWEGGMDSAGRVLDQQFIRSDSGSEAIVRRMDLKTGTVDTLRYPRCDLKEGRAFKFPHGFMRVPYAAGGISWLDPSGSVWCANTDRAVAYRAPFGAAAPVDSFVSSAVPPRVSDDERAEAIAEAEKLKPRAGEANLDYGLIPEVKAVLQGLNRDARGRLWMQIVDSAGPALHVFSPDGNWVARVWLDHQPAEYHHLAFHGNHVYAVGKDSLGAPVVYRFLVRLS